MDYKTNANIWCRLTPAILIDPDGMAVTEGPNGGTLYTGDNKDKFITTSLKGLVNLIASCLTPFDKYGPERDQVNKNIKQTTDAVNTTIRYIVVNMAIYAITEGASYAIEFAGSAFSTMRLSKEVARELEAIETTSFTTLDEAVAIVKMEVQEIRSLGAAANGFSKVGSNSSKMTINEIGEFLGEGANWHKTSAKSDFLKLFKKELKGNTNADFYIDNITKEVLLKGNKTGSWVKTGLFQK